MEEEEEGKARSEVSAAVGDEEGEEEILAEPEQEGQSLKTLDSVVLEDDTSSTSSDTSAGTNILEPGTYAPPQEMPPAQLRPSETRSMPAGKSITSVMSGFAGKRAGPGVSSISSKTKSSIFSLFSAGGSIESGGEDFTFEQIWGKNNEWIYGRYLRDMAKSIHKEHGQRAIDSMGGIPQGTRLRTPSTWVIEDFSTHVSTASIASTFVSPQHKAMATGELCGPEPKKEILTEIRDEINEEEYFFKQIHPQFSGNYSVLIWTPYDSISPRARLNSPYEIVSLSFCPHDGNFLVGGTSCGLVVLWDLTGRLKSKSETVHYSTDPSYIESQRVINNQLKWRRSKRSFNQLHPTAITPLKDSHNAKIVNIQWINCDKEFDIKTGKVIPIVKSGSSKPTLQFMTTSEDRVMKVWNMRCEPKPALGLRYPDKGFSRTAAAKRPENLQQSVSKFSELHRRWPCIYTAEPKHDDGSFFISDCAYTKEYYQYRPKPSAKSEDEKILEGAFFGCLNGEVGYMTWEGVPFESVVGSIDALNTQVFKTYHDGPVNCVARHPKLEHICLTTGGHVFAIWNLDFPTEPIKWVRYREVIMTYCGWSKMRWSVFRIARSDGLIEFWDLLKYSHRPKIEPLSTGSAVTMAIDLRIPPNKHFIAIADINAALRLYYIVGQISPLTDSELDRLKEMVDTEPERKKKLKEWSEKWVKEHVGRKSFDSAHRKEEALNQPVQVRTKDTEHPPCNPFMIQLYKWYIRRRGDKSVWLDDADKKWYAQEQAYMKTQILANKMWDQKKMDAVMRQLDVKEKRELVRKQRVQEILDQADEIFKSAVADIFLKKELELKASKISVKIDEPKEFDIASAIQETHLYFGENSEEFEKIKMEDVARFPVKERKMLDVLAKYRQVRMVFNDSRRNRDSKLKWLRSKLRKEVERYGCELIETQTKTNTLMKWEKYERRIRDIDELRDMYGVHYNPLWDKDKRVSKFEKRMAIGNIPVRYTVSKKDKRKEGLDLESIIEGEEISVLTPNQPETQKVDLKLAFEEPKDLAELAVEQETTVILESDESSQKNQLLQESLDKFTLPEIKRNVSFSDVPKEEAPPGGVLPLPDIVPRSESQTVETPRSSIDKDFRPYLETLLSQPTELSEPSDIEDFEPDIAVMEQHRDVDEIVDKLSSVYAMLKADVNIKPELHRFKWETTEEYLVSDEEEDKKSGVAEEEEEEEEDETPVDHQRGHLDDDLGSDEYIRSDSDDVD